MIKQKGKYDRVEIDYAQDDNEELQKQLKEKEAELKKNEEKDSGEVLDERVKSLVSFICDIKEMRNAMIEMDIDVKRMPLGRLSAKQISKGYTILSEIEKGLHGSHVYLFKPNLLFCLKK